MFSLPGFVRRVARALLLTIGIGAMTSIAHSVHAANVTVDVDGGQQVITVAGFGASIAWYAHELDWFSPANQTAILNALYSTTSPSAGLSYVRVGTFLNHYNPSPGLYDWGHWSIQGQINWIQRTKANYGVDRVLATTWSPPGYMKDNNSAINGGHVLPAHYGNLAALKVDWLQRFGSAIGTPVEVLSVQNEPDLSTDYESCLYTPAEMITFTVNHLKPALTNAGLAAKILVSEPSVYGGSSYFDQSWGFPLLNDAAMRSAVDILATHGYAQTSDLSAPSQAALQYGKPMWMTEDSTFDRYNGSITNGLSWSTEIYNALNKGNFSGYFYWWAMSRDNDNQALIKIASDHTSFTVAKRAYTIGHFSRFLRPGSVVVRSTSTNSTLQSTAATTPAGKFAIVLANTSKQSHTVTVRLANLGTSTPTSVLPYRTTSNENQLALSSINVSNGAFTITVPAQSIITAVAP